MAGPAERIAEALRLGLIPAGPAISTAAHLLHERRILMDRITGIDDQLAKLVQQYHPYRMIKDNPQA